MLFLAELKEMIISSRMIETILEGQVEEDATEFIDAYVELAKLGSSPSGLRRVIIIFMS